MTGASITEWAIAGVVTLLLSLLYRLAMPTAGRWALVVVAAGITALSAVNLTITDWLNAPPLQVSVAGGTTPVVVAGAAAAAGTLVVVVSLWRSRPRPLRAVLNLTPPNGDLLSNAYHGLDATPSDHCFAAMAAQLKQLDVIDIDFDTEALRNREPASTLTLRRLAAEPPPSLNGGHLFLAHCGLGTPGSTFTVDFTNAAQALHIAYLEEDLRVLSASAARANAFVADPAARYAVHTGAFFTAATYATLVFITPVSPYIAIALLVPALLSLAATRRFRTTLRPEVAERKSRLLGLKKTLSTAGARDRHHIHVRTPEVAVDTQFLPLAIAFGFAPSWIRALQPPAAHPGDSYGQVIYKIITTGDDDKHIYDLFDDFL